MTSCQKTLRVPIVVADLSKMAEEPSERLKLSVKTTKEKIDVDIPSDYTAKQVNCTVAAATILSCVAILPAND